MKGYSLTIVLNFNQLKCFLKRGGIRNVSIVLMKVLFLTFDVNS